MTTPAWCFLVAGVAIAFLAVGILIGRAIRAVNLAMEWDAGHAVGKAVGYAMRAAEELVPRPSEAMYPANHVDVAHEFADCLPNVTRGPWGAA